MKKKQLKLFINTKEIKAGSVYNAFQQEANHYSITPRSFESRTFTTQKNLWFIDKFLIGKTAIIRYGIDYNQLSENLIKKENIDCILDNNLGSVSTSKYTSQDVSSLKHYSLENLLLQKSVDYLLDSKNKSSVVVLDILERHKGMVKIHNTTSKPEVHSVVLYKNPAINGKHEIVVIDPSNFTFSSHLSNQDAINYLNSKAGLQNKKLFSSIKSIHKTLKIYQPLKKTGKLDSRDCIDLSVKIAAAMQELYISKAINLKSIKKLEIFKLFSNTTLDDYSIKGIKSPVRIKQSSDLSKVKFFYKAQKYINNLMQMSKNIIDLKHKNVYKKLKQEYTDILEKNGNKESVLKNLFDCHKKYNDILKQNVEELGKDLKLDFDGL